MPPVGMMSDPEVAATLTFIRQSWGNDAPPVDRSLVRRVRELHSGWVEAWTQEELTAGGQPGSN
jgi:hypothetical protein